jgi:hypothetical protein
MDSRAEQQAFDEIYQDIPLLSPSDIELSEMFESILSGAEEIPNLPHGYGQLVGYPNQT